MAVVRYFDRSVDPASRGKADDCSVGLLRDHDNLLQRLEIRRQFDVEHFGAVESQRFAVFTLLEFERQHAHADQIRAVNSLVRDGDDRSHA